MNLYLTQNELKTAVVDYVEKMVRCQHKEIGPVCIHQGGQMEAAEELSGDSPVIWIDDIEFDLDTRADK